MLSPGHSACSTEAGVNLMEMGLHLRAQLETGAFADSALAGVQYW